MGDEADESDGEAREAEETEEDAHGRRRKGDGDPENDPRTPRKSEGMGEGRTSMLASKKRHEDATKEEEARKMSKPEVDGNDAEGAEDGGSAS